MEGAHGVLLSIQGGSDLGLFEINDAASLVADAAHPDANIIFGAVIDDTLGDEVKVTVIAAGFDSGQLPYKKVDLRRDPAESPGHSTMSSGRPGESAGAADSASNRTSGGWPLGPGNGSAFGSGARRPIGMDEDLDVPDFLKN